MNSTANPQNGIESGRESRRRCLLALATLVMCPMISAIAKADEASNKILVHRKFKLDVRDGEIVADIKTIRVNEGEAGEIIWTSDRRTELHLHGYNILLQVKPNRPATMGFLAQTAGRFPIGAHMFGHNTLIILEVFPK